MLPSSSHHTGPRHGPIETVLDKIRPPPSMIRSLTVAAVENILKQSRSAIIDLLKVNGAMSVERLLESWICRRSACGGHLSLLESDGLVSS